MSKIDPQEPVLRLLFSPYHFRSNGKLHPKAFADKNNDLSLTRLFLTTKETCIEQARDIAKNDKSGIKKYAGICLLCPEQILTLKEGTLGFSIQATPSNNNPAHASLIIVDSEQNPIQIKEGKPNDNDAVSELLNAIVNGINNLSLGKMYAEKEFQETPLEELNGFCAAKTTPPTAS